MQKTYTHLGIYSDIVDEAQRQAPVTPIARPGQETQQKVRKVLGWCDLPEQPVNLKLERSWEKDGVAGEELSWSVGYGPLAHAWLLKPAGVKSRLPGMLALHDHGGFKFCGKEKIAEGEATPATYLARYREKSYGGRAWANALAREGYAVLVHDTFLWGSRRFPFEVMQTALQMHPSPQALEVAERELSAPAEVAGYNALAAHFEHTVEKYLNLLGTCLAGVVAHEDRIALNVLRARPEVDPGRLACMGLSGGGNRAGLLRATAEGLSAAVVVGLMSTYAGLLDHNVQTHTWMFFPSQWARNGDWTDLVACQAPAPLLVQYDLEDELFTVEGMRNADARLKDHYTFAGCPEAYTGQFYPGPHKFDLAMQEAAFAWLKSKIG